MEENFLLGLGLGATEKETSKSEFARGMWQLPAAVQQALKNRQLQLVDAFYYNAKPLHGGINHVNLFEAGDYTIKGICNVVQARVPADDYSMINVIRLRTATFTTDEAGSFSDEELIKRANWTSPIPFVANGEFMFANAATTYFDKAATSVFDHKDQTNIQEGAFRMPGKFFAPQTEIKLELDLVGTLPTTVAKAFVRVDLYGIKTIKA